MRPHWQNCITHRDARVDEFVSDYFAQAHRRCLVVGGAGFDPRALHVPKLLQSVLGPRLSALMIREERGNPTQSLQIRADTNEADLKSLIPSCSVIKVQVFADDGAPVGGARIAAELKQFSMPADLTDIVLDMSALSIGIGFPAARLLLEYSERNPELSFHLMITSNPALDETIRSEPDDRVMSVRGYAGALPPRILPISQIWLPQLAHGRAAALTSIRASLDGVYRTCPMLPFPAENPRRADELITEFGNQLSDDWEVHEGDLIYASEHNPLDSYRTISALKRRYDEVVEEVYEPQLILSPVGSKVMAVGAMMAAIEHELPVLYVETVRYDLPSPGGGEGGPSPDRIVHVWLDGPIYGGLIAGPQSSGAEAPSAGPQAPSPDQNAPQHAA
ncbi:MAG TPA: hypothetical protein VF688_11150 [Allosphingosinicella sp.]|jgi:hypothetical protein